jgi:hypothetical protein
MERIYALENVSNIVNVLVADSPNAYIVGGAPADHHDRFSAPGPHQDIPVGVLRDPEGEGLPRDAPDVATTQSTW